MLPAPDDDGSEDEEDADEGNATWADEGYQRIEDAPPEVLWLGVLQCNVGIVAVWRRCMMTVGVGMGVVWQGISAAEVRAACILSRVPRVDWPRYVDGVQLMGQIVARNRNEAEARRAKRKR